MGLWPGFGDGLARVNGQHIAYSAGGSGPPLLLLQGFPQTRMMWHGLVQDLARAHTVVAADLRGYGDSSRPADMDAMSFRAMAADQTALMAHLGFDRFHLAGHDRGARVAHRLALDAPDAVLSLTVMDIIPTHTLLTELSHQVASDYYHWFFLAQPAPFPETLIASDPDFFYQRCLLGFGKAQLSDFAPEALSAYRDSWRRPETIASMCNDYRAAIQIDLADDAADLDRRVTCPALVLYGRDGVMARRCDVAAAWAPRLAQMRAQVMPGGHFFPDQHPRETSAALLAFTTAL